MQSIRELTATANPLEVIEGLENSGVTAVIDCGKLTAILGRNPRGELGRRVREMPAGNPLLQSAH